MDPLVAALERWQPELLQDLRVCRAVEWEDVRILVELRPMLVCELCIYLLWCFQGVKLDIRQK